MRNFVIVLLFVLGMAYVTDCVLADTLYGLYGDNSLKQSVIKNNKNSSSKTYFNDKYMPNYYNSDNGRSNSTGINSLVEQGSKNYGEYSNVNKRTNPVRFDNPYNHLNDKYSFNPNEQQPSAVDYTGEAVRFKKNADGTIYGYDRYGKKVGVFRLNNNGTTSQYDMKGKKVGTLR